MVEFNPKYGKLNCSKCGKPKEPRRVGRHCYCLSCHSKTNIKIKKEKGLSPDAYKRQEARYKAKREADQGRLLKQPCQMCGSNSNVEKHHEDYSKPLEIVWLCKGCHRKVHNDDNFAQEVRLLPKATLLPNIKIRVNDSVNCKKCGKDRQGYKHRGFCGKCHYQHEKNMKNKRLQLGNGDY